MYLRLFFVYSGAVSAPLVFCSDPNATQTGIKLLPKSRTK